MKFLEPGPKLVNPPLWWKKDGPVGWLSGTLYKDEEKACLLQTPPVLHRCSEAFAAGPLGRQGYWRPDGPDACHCVNACNHCAPGTLNPRDIRTSLYKH